jgi:hypothetical protein
MDITEGGKVPKALSQPMMTVPIGRKWIACRSNPAHARWCSSLEEASMKLHSRHLLVLLFCDRRGRGQQSILTVAGGR